MLSVPLLVDRQARPIPVSEYCCTCLFNFIFCQVLVCYLILLITAWHFFWSPAFVFTLGGPLRLQETAPRQMGTTVSISNMFEPLPVRRGEFRRNIKKQYNRLLRGMQAYALISLGVRITVTNTKAKGGKQTLIGTQVHHFACHPPITYWYTRCHVRVCGL